MMMRLIARISPLLILVSTMGCASIDDPQYTRTPFKDYEGDNRPLSEVAIIINDKEAYLLPNRTTAFARSNPEWRHTTARLPGKQSLRVKVTMVRKLSADEVPWDMMRQGYRSGQSYIEHVKDPLEIIYDLKAGHRYKIIAEWIPPESLRTKVDLHVPGHEAPITAYTGERSPSSVRVALSDVTKDDDIWTYYRMNLSTAHQIEAVRWMTNPAHLKEVMVGNPYPPVRQTAVWQSNDTEILQQVIENDIDADVRRQAETRLQYLLRRP